MIDKICDAYSLPYVKHNKFHFNHTFSSKKNLRCFRDKNDTKILL